ncbi:hypothetical protein BS47DRAFT_717384 [Hydnum rufescens UP504]|uniref:Uncharacterized protein n=1 Tax=Hydnum rufescens UP504 TaxID=1448309 RepID=A0A9P6DW73_9AGAM|nr:hypothetical protein BS47DRAFT_717384 [Hydnum rufescens UP504]
MTWRRALLHWTITHGKAPASEATWRALNPWEKSAFLEDHGSDVMVPLLGSGWLCGLCPWYANSHYPPYDTQYHNHENLLVPYPWTGFNTEPLEFNWKPRPQSNGDRSIVDNEMPSSYPLAERLVMLYVCCWRSPFKKPLQSCAIRYSSAKHVISGTDLPASQAAWVYTGVCSNGKALPRSKAVLIAIHFAYARPDKYTNIRGIPYSNNWLSGQSRKESQVANHP